MNNPFDRNKIREPKLGHIITENGPEVRRDAVHIAIMPMVAAEHLNAGDSVALTADGTQAFRRERVQSQWDNAKQEMTYIPLEGSIGIVDPFLIGNVEQGQRFWLFIYPGQVTTLQHQWTHPAFLSDYVTPSSEQGPTLSQKTESERWLRAYALRYWGYSTPEEGYQKLLEQMKRGTPTYEGKDMHSRGDLHDADELRLHAEIVLGIKLNYDDFEYFSC